MRAGKLTAQGAADATPSEQDVTDAKAAWKRRAPARFRNLLDAKPWPPEEESSDVAGE